MLPTFSINPNPFDKKTVKKVFEIMNSLNDNPQNREWAGEAFLKAVMKDSTDNINLSSYANSCQRNSQMTQLSKNETVILTQEELNQGYVGVTDVVAEYVEDNIKSFSKSDKEELNNILDTFIKYNDNEYNVKTVEIY